MKRVILHAGFHKTGTSHVQRTLRANKARLSAHVALLLKRDMHALMRAARSFSSTRNVEILTSIATEMRRLLGTVNNAGCIVIAGEELSGHMPGRPRVADYSAAPILAELYWGVIREKWPDAEILFHYGLRAPENWLQSAYWEHVKSSSITLDLKDFETRYTAAADLAGVAQQIAALGPQTHTTELESANGPFGPAGPVLNLCDLPSGLNLRPQAPHNTRLPEQVLLDLLAANRAYPERAARKAAKRAILSKAGL